MSPERSKGHNNKPDRAGTRNAEKSDVQSLQKEGQVLYIYSIYSMYI